MMWTVEILFLFTSQCPPLNKSSVAIRVIIVMKTEQIKAKNNNAKLAEIKNK